MRLLRRLRYLLRGNREARELAEEIELHRAMAEDAQRKAGVLEDAAPAAARRLMGNATLASEDARGVWLGGWIESVFQDVHYAVRSLVSQPSFTGMALLALVLGIGLNTSLFTVVNSLMFHPAKVPDPESLVELLSTHPRFGYGGFPVMAVDYFNKNSQTIEGAYGGRAYPRLELEGGPKVFADFVSGGYFRVLHVPMAIGRSFDASEDVAKAPVAVAVLSHIVWKERFASDPAILGRTVRVNGVAFTVIGIAHESYTGTSEDHTDLWAPLAALSLAFPNDPDNLARLTDPKHCCTGISARLRPGVTRDRAQAELQALYRQFSSDANLEDSDLILTGTAMLDHPRRRQQFAPVAAILLVAVGSILLLACANVSNLLLARAAARQREFAVRVAIGAGRGRVIRQLLTESLLLAAIAAAGGLSLAYVLPGLTMRLAGEAPPENFDLKPDANVLAYALGLAVVSALAFGLAPALRGTRVSVAEAMKRQSAHSSPRIPLRGTLLGIQVAISVALLMAAGLLTRGLSLAREADPGFQVQDVSAMQVTLPPNVYNPAREAAFYDELQAKLGEQAGLSVRMPLGGFRDSTDFKTQCAHPTQIMAQRVTKGYFDVLKIPVLVGRNFRPEDRSRGAILVNETLARACWEDRSPLGQQVMIQGRSREVVGVVRDAQLHGIGQVDSVYFAPFVPDGSELNAPAVVLVPSSSASGAVAALREMDAGAAAEVIPMSDQFSESLGDTVGVARIAGALGLFALLLATVGVYGVISYSVEQRRREIGVRMALGARPAQVVGLVLRRNARPIGIGLAVGMLIAVGETVVLESELYGLSPADPIAYLGVLAVLSLAGLAACVIPAARAARTDAVTALHYD